MKVDMNSHIKGAFEIPGWGELENSYYDKLSQYYPMAMSWRKRNKLAPIGKESFVTCGGSSF